jgi:hypothetical protein
MRARTVCQTGQHARIFPMAPINACVSRIAAVRRCSANRMEVAPSACSAAVVLAISEWQLRACWCRTVVLVAVRSSAEGTGEVSSRSPEGPARKDRDPLDHEHERDQHRHQRSHLVVTRHARGVPLRLVDQRAFRCGNVVVTYVPA